MRMQRRRPELPELKALDPAAMLACAATQLMAGDALAAQRTARTAEQLILLETRLQRRTQINAAANDERERALDARERSLEARHAAFNQREFDLACEAQRLEEIKASLKALYAQMYNKRPEE